MANARRMKAEERNGGCFWLFKRLNVLAEFYRRLIKGLGFMDGAYGVIESIYQAFSKTITYLFLYEKSRNQKN